MKYAYLMNYVPVSAEKKYGYRATQSEISDRQAVWNFKDGICSSQILNAFADRIKSMATSNSVVCFVPASTSAKTAARYGELSRKLQAMTGVQCSYTAIRKTVDGESGHIAGKSANPAADFSFDQSFFKGKNVILIDDVVTRGATLAGTGERLLSLGAGDVFGLVVAKTVNPVFDSSYQSRHSA